MPHPRSERSGILTWMCVLTSFTNAVARTGALFSVIPILARDRLALSTGRIGLGLALASLVGLALAYPAGVVADHYGRKAVIVPATLLAGLSLVLFVLAPTYAWFLFACVAWSVAAGIGGAAPAAYAADVAPPRMSGSRPRPIGAASPEASTAQRRGHRLREPRRARGRAARRPP